MQTSPDNDIGGKALADLAPQHLANLLNITGARNAAPDEGRAGGAMRLAPGRTTATQDEEAAVRLTGSATADEEKKPLGLTAGMLRFLAATPAPDGAGQEWRVIGSIELLRVLNAEPDWIDLLCMARRGHQYTVLPVMLEEPNPDDPDEAEGSHRLVLHWATGAQVDAAQLREAFESEYGVLGAFTESGFGVFVSLVFDLS